MVALSNTSSKRRAVAKRSRDSGQVLVSVYGIRNYVYGCVRDLHLNRFAMRERNKQRDTDNGRVL